MIQELQNRPHLAILAAVGLELQPLRARLKRRERLRTPKPLRLEIWETPCGPIYLGTTGMGPHAAHRSLHTLLTQYRPSVILSVGLAGALDQTLAIGDLILAQDCQKLTTLLPPLQAHGLESNQNISRENAGRFAGWLNANGETIRTGTFVSAPGVVTHAETKALIRNAARAPALGVEMETAALLETAAQGERVEIYCLRAISDLFGEDLDFDFSQFHHFTGEVNPWGALKYFMKNPGAAWRLRKLVANSNRAAERLAQAVFKGLAYPDFLPAKDLSEVDVHP